MTNFWLYFLSLIQTLNQHPIFSPSTPMSPSEAEPHHHAAGACLPAAGILVERAGEAMETSSTTHQPVNQQTSSFPPLPHDDSSRAEGLAAAMHTLHQHQQLQLVNLHHHHQRQMQQLSGVRIPAGLLPPSLIRTDAANLLASSSSSTSTSSSSSSSFEEMPSCCICSSPLLPKHVQDVFESHDVSEVLSCHHKFNYMHAKCLAEWLSRSGPNASCPVCRYVSILCVSLSIWFHGLFFSLCSASSCLF